MLLKGLKKCTFLFRNILFSNQELKKYSYYRVKREYHRLKVEEKSRQGEPDLAVYNRLPIVYLC